MAARVALLDVNLLVALFDADHVHHELAHDWFADHRANGWATCPATENGFVRVVSNPAYGLSLRPDAVLARLRTFCGGPHHVFWPDAVSLTDPARVDPAFLAGARQVTDVSLLALAVHMKGALATFDRTIPLKAVRGATRESLMVIGAVD